MLHERIKGMKTAWLARPDCPVAPLLRYIRDKGALRPPQVEAVETYLFLKLEGGNKPLWQLFAEGFFASGEDLSTHPIAQVARDHFARNPAALALYDFLGWPAFAHSDLRAYVAAHAATLDAEAIIREFFYNIGYTDYLFSLPMGAGKTFLMAALIYIDLYYSDAEPANPLFARNFMVMAPSGLKSSIVPSLKTIERFDPSWVLPEPAASQIRRQLRFEVLDAAKTGKKSGKARNPNAQKIAQFQPFEDARGLVLVVNAEKVILDRVEAPAPGRNLALGFTESDDEKDRAANELRNLLGKLPGLQIHIDEVHHAATDDIKLRQVVSRWQAGGTVNSVIGYSGTPYLSKPEKVALGEGRQVKFAQITNTVYYYPLTAAVRSFLKKPRVEQTKGLPSLDIIRKGVEDFRAHYDNTRYPNGACAKLAIYCGAIERLETEVFPLLTGLGIPAERILKYHGGNKEFKAPPDAALEFGLLDTPLSNKQVVLLVQIGKEGWDCRSLTGVILSQKGDCPTNMVLQTSCRCLRQVTPGARETALIYLNEENAAILDKQLKEEQQTSISELNRLAAAEETPLRPRHNRTAHLKLPPLAFYQLRVHYSHTEEESEPHTAEKMGALSAAQWEAGSAEQTRREIGPDGLRETTHIYESGNARAHFGGWLAALAKGSFGAITVAQLRAHTDVLRPLFDTITFERGGARHFNRFYPIERIETEVRNAFRCRRSVHVREELVHTHARLLVVEALKDTEDHRLLYPSEGSTEKMIALDAKGLSAAAAEAEEWAGLEKARALLEAQGLGAFAPQMQPQSYTDAALHHKDCSFHVAPYNFRGSEPELVFLQKALELADLRQRGLEVYYNGERHLTEFRIDCYEQTAWGWKRVGRYTPDFLVVSRRDGAIYKALIVEIKGSGYAADAEFLKKKAFMEGPFLEQNRAHFGYERFDFIYLPVGTDVRNALPLFSKKIQEFFND